MPVSAATVEYWTVRGGTAELMLEPPLSALSTVPVEGRSDYQPAQVEPVQSFSIDADSTLFVVMSDGVVTEMSGSVRQLGTIRLPMSNTPTSTEDFWFNVDLDSGIGTCSTRNGRPWLTLRNLNIQFDRKRSTLVITSDELDWELGRESPSHHPTGTNRSAGSASIKIELVRVDEQASSSLCTKGIDQSTGDAVTRATIGPDVIVGQLDALGSFGSAGTCSVSGAVCTNANACPPPESCDNKIAAFSVSTLSCNIGDAEIDWFQSTNRHPVISQTMFRLKNDRFEQIGLAWVKHGFSTINGTFCSLSCQVPASPYQTTRLGIGCSDPYTANLNGERTYLGPRSDVNPHTGSFTIPFDAPPFDETIGRRLQVHESDLDPGLNPGALYFVEGLYITPDDATAHNGNNNASYRRITIDPPSQSNNFKYEALRSVQTGLTQVGQQAIRVWKDFDDDVVETDIQIPGEGLLILAAKATDLGTGYWHYEYALQNMNSDSAGSSFTVPLPQDAQVENPGFHDVDYHSGESIGGNSIDGTDWASQVDPVARTITWSTQTYAENPNANALRWGTLYNFRFDVNAEPNPAATVVVGLFKGPLPSVDAITTGPSAGVIDCNHNEIADACDIDCGMCGGSGIKLKDRTARAGTACGMSSDCNGNNVPDECERDCNSNGIADTCDIATCPPGDLWCADCNENTVPDGCEADCDGDGIPSACDLSEDTDGDGLDDCMDACPRTFTEESCSCPNPVCCYFPFAGCVFDCTAFSSEDCLAITGAVPDCIESNKCRDGCLLGDADETGVLDLRDFAAFQGCFGGPITEECSRFFDFTGDSSVNLDDYTRFVDALLGLSGIDNPCLP